MGRRCSVCDHAERAAIEAAIAAGGASNRRIATRFGVSEAAIRRHRSSHLGPQEAIVGRERELRELEAGLAAVSAGRGQLFLVVGEPGIGKSRLLREVATRAVPRGFAVVWGRCWEAGGAPALWPWTQVLRSLVRAGAIASGPGADVVGRLDPELGAETDVDTDATRVRLFASIVDVLRDAADAHPLVLLLDDVHAADRASLHLLHFAARELHDAPVLIVATYRDVEARRSPDLARVLADVAREGHRLPLTGLVEADVARMIENVAGAPPESATIRAIFEATEGNPFFVDEIARLYASRSSVDDAAALMVPDGVRDAIRATLGPLAPSVRELLDVAAVAGREFSAAIIGAVREREPDVVREELLTSGVVLDVAERLSFSHSLVRETIYDDLTPGTRVMLHRLVGEALERTQDARSSELAHHFFHAAQAGCAPKALDASARAGDEAMAVFAYEEASEHYQRALQAVNLIDPDEERRCDLLIALGEAQWGAGEAPRSNQTLRQAVAVARRLNDAKRLAGAVRRMSAEGGYGEGDDSWVGLLDETLSRLGPDDGADRAALLARRAVAVAVSDPDASAATSDESVAMARRIGDRPTLGSVLVWALRARWGPDTVTERTALADELCGLSGAVSVDRVRALEARVATCMELGDRRSAGEAFRELEDVADALMLPSYRWLSNVVATAMLMVDGRFDEAERRASEAYEIGTLAQEEGALLTYGAQLVVMRRDQGRLAELEDTLVSSAERLAAVRPWHASLAALYAESGRDEQARAVIERLPVARLPHDVHRLLTAALLAEAFSALGDAVRAGEMYEQLVPYTGRIVPVGYGTAYYGPVDRYLGILAATCRRFPEAERHFVDALATARRMGARAWTGHVLCEHARMLLTRGTPDDRTTAAGMLAEGVETYRALGMDERVRAASAELDALGPRPDVVGPPSTDHALLRPDGSSWTIVHGSSTMRVRDSLGMRYLAYLLERPGRELHVLDLVASASGKPLASGDAGDVLDPAAREAYRARVDDLRAEIDEAQDRGDADRAARLQDELDAIARELSVSLGLGGRSRKAASEAERARLNVRRAIRTAITAVDQLSPSLGRYLETTVRTGTFCTYVPDPRFPIVWDVVG